MGDYGKYAVHITDQEERRHPETETANEDDTGITTDGARRLAKGGRLPRPIFNMASGQDNFNTEYFFTDLPGKRI